MIHFFTKMVIQHWNKLPGEVVDASRLSVIVRYLDNATINTSAEVVRQFDSRLLQESWHQSSRYSYYSDLRFSY